MLQYDLTGKLIRQYDSIYAAATGNDIDVASLNWHLGGKNRHQDTDHYFFCRGYLWRPVGRVVREQIPDEIMAKLCQPKQGKHHDTYPVLPPCSV